MAVLWSKVTNMFNRYKEQNRQDSLAPQQKDVFGKDATKKNPNIKVFNNAQNNIADIVDRRSVVSQFHDNFQHEQINAFSSSVFDGITATPLLTNKVERIRQYRAMAQYPECDFCICELADDFLHEDEDGEVIHLRLPEKSQMNELQKDNVMNEFNKFIGLFNLKDDAYGLVKRFLIDGEVAFENIINPNMPDLGIIGIRYLPTEYYEVLVNRESGKTIGIFFDKDKLDQDLRNVLSNSAVGSATIFNNMIQSQGYGPSNNDNCIPILWPQLTYISSGEETPDGLITLPLVEKCKQAYHQLALMQDAAVILRVTRAPERLLFNINVGGIPNKKAQQLIKDFENEYKSKKIIRQGKDGGDLATIYNPTTMLETFFSGKTSDNDGTTVETVSSTADYEQIADIDWFLRRLFKAFKVPFTRYKVPENEISRNDVMNYEEYSMSRFEIRMQRRFANALKRSFITHLKLRKLWDKYKLKETDIDIEFEKPVLWDLYNKQKLITTKMEIYEKCVEQDELSKITAMKKYLGMTDEEIDMNFRNLIKEKQYSAMTDYFGDLVGEHRPVDYTSPIRLAGVDGVPPESTNAGDEGGEGGLTEPGGEGGIERGPEPDREPGDSDEGSVGEEPEFGLG